MLPLFLSIPKPSTSPDPHSERPNWTLHRTEAPKLLLPMKTMIHFPRRPYLTKGLASWELAGVCRSCLTSTEAPHWIHSAMPCHWGLLLIGDSCLLLGDDHLKSWDNLTLQGIPEGQVRRSRLGLHVVLLKLKIFPCMFSHTNYYFTLSALHVAVHPRCNECPFTLVRVGDSSSSSELCLGITPLAISYCTSSGQSRLPSFPNPATVIAHFDLAEWGAHLIRLPSGIMLAWPNLKSRNRVSVLPNNVAHGTGVKNVFWNSADLTWNPSPVTY